MKTYVVSLFLLIPHFLSLNASIEPNADYLVRTQEVAPVESSKEEDDSCCGLPSAGKYIEGTDFYLTADLILWIAQQEGMEICFGNVAQHGSSNLAMGYTQSPAFKVRPGFKVGFGYTLDHGGWNVKAEYSWLKSYSTPINFMETMPPADYQLFPYNPIEANPVIGISGISQTWELLFNNLTIDLLRPSFWSLYQTVTPYFGLQGTWQTQRYYVNYDPYFAEQSVTLKQNFAGVGLRSGCNATFALPVYTDFSIVMGSGASLIYGGYSNSFSSIDWDQWQFKQITTGNSKNVQHALAPVLEWRLGLNWDYIFGKKRSYHIGLQALYEQQSWLYQNHYNFLSTMNKGGALSLSGFTLQFRIDF